MGQLVNFDTASFTNLGTGTITITGTSENSGRLANLDSASFTNSGTITITGTSENSGRLANLDSASFTNSGTITITGTSENSGRLVNLDTATFTNSGKIKITTTSFGNSGRFHNESTLINSGLITTNNDFINKEINSVVRNTGSILVTDFLNNRDGFISDCGQTPGKISFTTFIGNVIKNVNCKPGSSGSHQDPTIGITNRGLQVVENGICINITCWTVTENYHQDFELVELLSDSTNTISVTVYCQRGVDKCNYVAFGVSPYGTNINDSVWKVILQKDHQGKWSMTVIDPDGYLGDVTSTTQIVNDGKHLGASMTALFKKPTPGMILNVETRDSDGGYSDNKFNDGISIKDVYAYPVIETSYEKSLEVEPLCLNENPNKRYTCAFEKVREWTIKNAEKALSELG